jgi:membrane protein DedA with SNARE-associated domain
MNFKNLKIENLKKEIFENKEIFISFGIALLIFATVIFLWKFAGLPDQDTLVEMVKGFFTKYGLPVIFISSILESLLLIGNYFPGSLVIFLGVSMSAGQPLVAIKTILVVCAGMFVGYNVNYFLGKFGLYKAVEKFGYKNEIKSLEKKIEEKGVIAGFFLYIMPGMGSLISTTFGVVKYNYLKFISFTIVTMTFWNSLWGILVYFFGMKIFDIMTSYVSIFVILVLYFIYMYRSGKFEELKKS